VFGEWYNRWKVFVQFNLRLADVGIVSDCRRCNYAATYVLEISNNYSDTSRGKKWGNGNDLKLLAKQHPSHPNHIL
jgi:hypothetical protein